MSSARWNTGRAVSVSPESRNSTLWLMPPSYFTSKFMRIVGADVSDDQEAPPNSGTKAKEERHRDAEKEPLPEWPDGVNPKTGEKGGPKGPEPTRYGDWERKGRVSDF